LIPEDIRKVREEEKAERLYISAPVRVSVSDGISGDFLS